MTITIPEFCLVALLGPASAEDRCAFLRRLFKDSEIVAPEACRLMVADEDAEDAAADAADLVRSIVEKRLKRRRLTAVDASGLPRDQRAHLVNLARRYHAATVAIVLGEGPIEGMDGQTAPPGHDRFGEYVDLRTAARAAAAVIERRPIRTDQRHEHGPFDVIGDVHGCADELEELLARLGYSVRLEGTAESRRAMTTAPPGRRAVFVGDLVDRGPRSPDVLRIAMQMVAANQAFAVPGNHDIKFLRWLGGRQVKLTHGLDRTVAQIANEPPSFRQDVAAFLDGLVSHLWLDGGRLAVAHAGVKEEMLGRSARAVREFCAYGETSGETDEFGLPIRYHWAADYRGKTAIVYGHTPVPEAAWFNNTLCIDTGAAFGGTLTALRWPEKEIVSVPAARVYSEPIRPFGHPPLRPRDMPVDRRM
jgi:calcineurin-like phosphoesterase family protein